MSWLRRGWLLVGVLSTHLLLTSATALTLEGVVVADTVPVANTSLTLNGAGVRTKLFMSIYVGALYLPAKANTLPGVLAQTGPKQLALHFVYKKLPPEKLVAAWNEGFNANLSPVELTALAASIRQFNQWFTQEAVQGTVYRINEIPGVGTQLWINDQLKGTIAEAGFYPALLQIWLGAKPVTTELKQALLGN